jgi:protein-S-isoprenylcysteine O-methyltransferase Ste14
MLPATMEAKAAVAEVEACPTGTPERPSLPRAPTAMAINLAGIGVFLAAVACLRVFGARLNDLAATLVALGAYAGTVIGLEARFLKPWRRSSTGLDFSRPAAATHGRALAKLVGFYATLVLAFGIYTLFPEYRESFYFPFYRMLRWVIPVAAALAVPYFFWLERFNQRPLDGYWQVSLVLRGRLRDVDRQVLGQHLLGWLVKAFFTPLMFVYCQNAIARFRSFDPHWVLTSFNSFYDFTYDSLFGIDVVLAVTGYLLTVRLLDSHIRSTEPTLLGWAVALGCYQPFWSFVEGRYLSYGAGGSTWGVWFSGTPVIYVAWGSAILALTAVYLWATIPFGIRFSNLTNRGILTNGPYRFTKHPAYVSKNLSWWLISMPFLSSAGWQPAMRCSLMLVGLNVIYFLRARTEERHLSRDPDYVAYAQAMERRGGFRWLGRIVPALRFRPGRLFDLQP